MSTMVLRCEVEKGYVKTNLCLVKTTKFLISWNFVQIGTKATTQRQVNLIFRKFLVCDDISNNLINFVLIYLTNLLVNIGPMLT